MSEQAVETSSAIEKWGGFETRGLLKQDGVSKVLTFLLATEEYAIDILFIEEITRPFAVTYVPRVAPYILGVVSLRGRVIPILNLHARLGLASFVPGDKNRFVICQMERSEVGIVVDKVSDVVNLTSDQLQAPPAKIAASGSGFIKNIGRVKDRILIILDVEKVLRIHQETGPSAE